MALERGLVGAPLDDSLAAMNQRSLTWALALFFIFCRPHKTLSKPYPKTLAIAAGLTDHLWTVEDIIALLGRSGR